MIYPIKSQDELNKFMHDVHFLYLAEQVETYADSQNVNKVAIKFNLEPLHMYMHSYTLQLSLCIDSKGYSAKSMLDIVMDALKDQLRGRKKMDKQMVKHIFSEEKIPNISKVLYADETHTYVEFSDKTHIIMTRDKFDNDEPIIPILYANYYKCTANGNKTLGRKKLLDSVLDICTLSTNSKEIDDRSFEIGIMYAVYINNNTRPLCEFLKQYEDSKAKKLKKQDKVAKEQVSEDNDQVSEKLNNVLKKVRESFENIRLR